MKSFRPSILLSVAVFLMLDQPGITQEADTYPVPPEATVVPGVPQGTVEGPFQFRSEIYPGTVREYWVYVPAQYDPAKPACLMIVQDGLNRARGWKLPQILDNLIHSEEVPVQLGLFVQHGQVPAANEDSQPRFNRSFEYDSVGDRYARFLIEEMIPEVQKKWSVSENPNHRCIAGSSSGGICAFNAAWERPDAFRRVLSTVGTFVGLRGADEFPTLVRKTEPIPLRIFLQDGSNDLDIYAGSWWHANQSMLSALQFAGYDVRHVWGEGGHNSRHAAAIMPEALKWLWRDYPAPVGRGMPKPRRADILPADSKWELVSSGHGFTEGPAADDRGNLYFTDIPNDRIHKVDTAGVVSIFADETGASNGLAVGPNGFLYACQADGEQIVRYDLKTAERSVFVQGLKANDILVLPDGSGYCSEPGKQRVIRFERDGTWKVAADGIEFPNGLVTSPDQTRLWVSDTRGRFVMVYRIEADGSLSAGQEYGWLHASDHIRTDADGMAADTNGFVYVTTATGLQIMDQLGRVNFIMRKPNSQWLSNVTFGGPDQKILYVTCGDSVYRRTVNTVGALPRHAPRQPPRPGL